MWLQFLPQDKVCEFARLTSIELLLETEKAVGDPVLPAMHSQLILAMKVISELANVRFIDFIASFPPPVRRFPRRFLSHTRSTSRRGQNEQMLRGVSLKLRFVGTDLPSSVVC